MTVENTSILKNYESVKKIVNSCVYLLSIVVVFLLPSCGRVQVGRNFQVNDTSQIEIGKTTKDGILELFNEPFTVIDAAEWKRYRAHFGYEDTVLIWNYKYEYSTVFVFMVSSAIKSMQIEFDAADRVIGCYWESEFQEDVSPKATKYINFDLFKARNQIRIGKITKIEVIDLLGENYTSTALMKSGVAEHWHYTYREISKGYCKNLDVFFDSNGIVSDYKGDSNFPNEIGVK